jgi:predicted nuclease of predicted toxin-antitoxin system
VILLFDQNLSFRLTRALADIYPGALHAKYLGLTASDDKEIWLYAAANDCAIVSKDSDFYQRSLLHGYPPKVLWIRRGNCSTKVVEEILRQHLDDIEQFMLDPGSACLMLW